MDEFTGGVIITSEASLINGYPIVLTVNEVASILKISRSKAYELVNSKGFPTKHIGRRLRIPRDMFFTWLNNLDTKERDTPQSWKAAKNYNRTSYINDNGIHRNSRRYHLIMAKKRSRGNGEGTIYKCKSGYACQVTVGRKTDGSLDMKTVYGKSKPEIVERRDKIVNELRTGMFVREDKIPFGEWLDFWLKEYKSPPNIRLSTYISYETFIRVHIKPQLGNIYLSDLRPDHLQRFYNGKLRVGRADGKEGGVSVKTLRNIHNTVHEALDQALKCGHVFRNVSEATSLPKMTKSDIRVLTLKEMNIFMKAIENEFQRTAFLLSLSSGLRLGELLALTWDNVDLEEGILKVRRTLNRLKTFDEKSPKKTKLVLQDTPKTSTSRRNVPIPLSIVEELKKHKEKQIQDGLDNPLNLVITSEVGTPFEPRNFIRALHRIVKDCGLPHLNVHALRHTFATRLLEENERPKVVQEMLGHSTIGITLDTYTHVMPELKKCAAEKMNRFFDNYVMLQTQ